MDNPYGHIAFDYATGTEYILEDKPEPTLNELREELRLLNKRKRQLYKLITEHPDNKNTLDKKES